MSGFRRWKPSFVGVLTPEGVEKRLGLLDEKTDTGDEAVAALDRVATRNFAPMLPSRHYLYKLSDGQLSNLLGLDQQSAEKRLRAAVARAYRKASDYTEAFVSFCEDRDLVAVGAARLRKIAGDLEAAAVLRSVATLDDRYLGPMSAEADVHEARRMLLANAERMDGWAEAARNWQHEAHRPDRFLYLRLAEIYTLLFGVQAPLHQSGERGKSNSPDELFSEFLTAALRSFDWPTPHTSRDDALRGLNTKVFGGYPYVRRGLDQLLEKVLDERAVLRHEDLISLGWLIDFDPKNKRGLI